MRRDGHSALRKVKDKPGFETFDPHPAAVTEESQKVTEESRERFEKAIQEIGGKPPMSVEEWGYAIWQAAERSMAERAAQIADDDLLGNDEIAPWTERADGGYSAATAQRIARKIRALSSTPEVRKEGE